MDGLSDVRERRVKRKRSSIVIFLDLLTLLILACSSTCIRGALEEGDQYSKSCKNTIQGRHFLADDHAQWWDFFGKETKRLRWMAMRILSQPCSSSACERSWSVFEHIHSKKRNRLSQERMNDLVFVHHNLRLKMKKAQSYICGVLSINPFSGCCPQMSMQFSCQGCNLSSQCCDSYEFCVSCCLNPAQTVKELAIKMKVAKHATAGTYGSVFNYCTGSCRHNSASVVHENAYASEMHHCFSLQLTSSGLVMPHSEVKLSDISIIIGRKGQSCTLVCKSRGQSCILRRLLELNKCEVLQKYLSCKGACIGSIGSDQPAEVINDAPRHLHPGACLFSTKRALLSCDGSHPYTRRLCPCA